MKLSDLQNKESGIITKVQGIGAFRKRITEMGFVKGKKVTVVKNAPLRDPIEYKIMGYEISLRRSEAELIEVITKEEAKNLQVFEYNGVIGEEKLRSTAIKKGRTIELVLIGNPNSGKTTLFNFASNSRERVGNYSGVTVDSKAAVFKHRGYTFNITDLPGTYSLSAYSPEELYVRKYISEKQPDIIINVVDSSNLERNLYLTTQLIDMDMRVIIALNMFDELRQKGDIFDYEAFGSLLGTPVVPTVSSRGTGIRDLFDTAINVFNNRDKTVRHIHINYGKEIEDSIKRLREVIKSPVNQHLAPRFSSRFMAIKLLEKDKDTRKYLKKYNNYNEIIAQTEREAKKLEALLNEDCETMITDARYGFISGALRETYKGGAESRKQHTQLIDHFLTHKIFGFPIFFAFMWIMFQATFNLGQYPMSWIETLVGWLSFGLNQWMPDGSFKELLVDGVISGVGGVIVFLPNILLLFFFISLMEDTGYMARAAFIMDRIMHKIGLHGKSFIPLIMGFGCNVPAIMATRTIENRNSRLLTILINPFMSCSARLPVYVLIIGAFFPQHAGTVLFAIYLTGIAIAALIATIFRKTILTHDEVPFVMELPPYRVPLLKTTTRHMWHKGVQYLQKMGGVILTASVIIWALGHYPRQIEYERDYDSEIIGLSTEFDENINSGEIDQESLNMLTLKKDSMLQLIELEKKSEHQAKTYIGQIGHFIEPMIAPLGFDWKMGVSLLTGIAAKEIVISTMAVLYQVDDGASNTVEALGERLKNQTFTNGEKAGQLVFTIPATLAFLMFILVYFPCVAVVAAIKKETGHWKWAAFTVFYTTGLAWLLAFIVYQVGKFIL